MCLRRREIGAHPILRLRVKSFGGAIADSGLAQHLIAENEIDLAATRALRDAACAKLDAGSAAAHETSIAKTFGAEAIGRVVDRSVQLCGGMGLSADLPVSRIAREVRPFRIYDGPSEVHRMAIAKRATRTARLRSAPLRTSARDRICETII